MRQHVHQHGQVRTEDKHGNLESNLTIQKFFFQIDSSGLNLLPAGKPHNCITSVLYTYTCYNET